MGVCRAALPSAGVVWLPWCVVAWWCVDSGILGGGFWAARGSGVLAELMAVSMGAAPPSFVVPHVECWMRGGRSGRGVPTTALLVVCAALSLSRFWRGLVLCGCLGRIGASGHALGFGTGVLGLFVHLALVIGARPFRVPH
jgi:hypothetical protein